MEKRLHNPENTINNLELVNEPDKFGDHDEACAQLQKGKITSIEDIDIVRPELVGQHQDQVNLATIKPINDSRDPHHMDKVESVRLRLKGKDVYGVFKPHSGENIFFTRKTGIEDHYKRERAAYLVDQWLGFGLVPPTVIRTINREIGSLQKYIVPQIADSHKLVSDQVDFAKESLSLDWLHMALFDYIIANIDRSTSNWLVNKSDNAVLYAIDNGSSFCTGVVKEYEKNGPRNQLTEDQISGTKKETSIPAATLELLRVAITKVSEIKHQLSTLLPDYEIENMISRIVNLVERKIVL